MPEARRENFWKQFHEDDRGDDLEAAARYIQNHPDAGVTEVLAQTGLDLDMRADIERLLEEARGAGDGAGDDAGGDSDSTSTRVGHWMDDDCDVYGGRSTTSSGRVRHVLNTEPGTRGWLGNPFVQEDLAEEKHRRQEDVTIVASREEAVTRFVTTFLDAVDSRPSLRRALYEDVRGAVVGGWCQHLDEDSPQCHLEVVASVADRLEAAGGRQ